MRSHEETTDRGSALTMAIVFVTVIGLAMAIGLGYAATTIRATSKAYMPARAQLYAANAAVKTAVAFTQKTPSEGRYVAAGTCAPARTYGTVDGTAVTSQVCPRTSTSLTSGGGDGAFGLRTMAIGTEKGIEVSGQGGLTVYGNVAANSAIDVANSSRFDVAGGTVKAVGGCNQNVYVDGVLINGCTVPASPAPAVDPLFVITPPDPLPAGSGSCSDNVATLEPGLWTSSLLSNAIDDCDYVWLKPGYHVLDDVSWSVRYRVVGGTLNGSIKTSALGSGCVAGAATGGATIVLGGTSSIALSGATATIEVCGQNVTQTDGSVVRLPLYGLTADIVGPVTTATMTNSGNPTQTSTSATDWSNISRARVVDTTSLASVSLAASASTEELRIPGFTASPAAPSTVTQISVTVWGSSNRSATFRVVGRNGSGSQVCGTAAAPTTAGVTGTFPSAYDQTVVTLTCTPSVPGSLTIGIVATSGGSPTQARTVSVDGVQVSFQRPGTAIVSAQSGSIAQAGGTAALSTNGNTNLISLEGQIYMPLGKVDVQLPNASGAFTTEGVTVRVFKVNTPASVVVKPIVATDYGGLKPGDVTIVVKLGTSVYMTCRVTFAVSGSAITGSTITACTPPR